MLTEEGPDNADLGIYAQKSMETATIRAQRGELFCLQRQWKQSQFARSAETNFAYGGRVQTNTKGGGGGGSDPPLCPETIVSDCLETIVSGGGGGSRPPTLCPETIVSNCPETIVSGGGGGGPDPLIPDDILLN